VDLVRVGGTIACVGIPEGDMVPIAKAFPQILIGKALRIIGVAVGNRQEAIETLDLAARGIIKAHYVKDKLENLTQIFQDMQHGKLNGRVVLELQ
jgi:propanol-preferring alcohol dehydrogenase